MLHMVQLSVVLAGTVETFDHDGFKTGLAAKAGVAPEVISLTVTAASVNVVATITTNDASIASSVLVSVQAP